jgi:hypothetical protein
MRFEELNKPEIGDILEVEIGNEVVETVIVGITDNDDYLCETTSRTGIALLESRSDWDSNMPGYKGDYGGAENWGRRNREDDEHHEIDRQREQQLAQYNQAGNFWLKYKDSGKHINDQPYTGKAAANAAAQMMIRSNPQVKGNLLITAYGPGESQGVAEGPESKKFKVTYELQNGDVKEKIMIGKDTKAVAKYFEFKYRHKPISVVEQGVAEGSDDKEPFDYEKWKASTVKPRKPRGYKDAEALGKALDREQSELRKRKEQGVAEGSTFPGPLSDRELSKVGRQIKSSQGRDSNVTSPHQRKDWYNPNDSRSSKQQKLDYLKSLKGSQGVTESYDLDAFSGIKFLNPETGKMGSFYYWSSVEGKNEAYSMITNKKLVPAHNDGTPMTWDEYKQALDGGNQSVAEAATPASVSKVLRLIGRHHPEWFDNYGMGEVEDTVVDMKDMGEFDGMSAEDALALVGQELESLYGQQGMGEGYTVTRGIDTERYQERAGLEGPFSAKNGKVVYYDKREGKYYDPDTDMYIEHDEWQAMNEAEYQGRDVELNKPMAGDVAKSKVYVKNPETGKVVKVNFGDKNMRIKKSNPDRRKSFRARHNCENPGPKTKARYWSCRAW